MTKNQLQKNQRNIRHNKLLFADFERSNYSFPAPHFRFPYLDNVALQAGYGFVEAMLEPHAKEAAGMTQAQVGWAFLIMGASYMAQTPIVGHVSKKILQETSHCLIS